MKRLLLGATLVAAALAVALLPASTAADIGDLTQTTQVVLSCTDGHSVALSADPSMLSSLTADVQAINASGTGTSCSTDTSTADPPAPGANWTVYDYNASGQEIAPRNSPNSRPATTVGATTKFDFLFDHYTALLTTNDKSLTGDLSLKMLSDDIQVMGPAPTFDTQRDCAGPTATVRFFFVSPAASGKGGALSKGFYTQFWWSNPMHIQLLTGNQGPTTLSVSMSDLTQWSDWNGTQAALVPDAFETAIRNVQTIGLSFGGECFFETGVRADYTSPPTTAYETFSSTFSEN